MIFQHDSMTVRLQDSALSYPGGRRRHAYGQLAGILVAMVWAKRKRATADRDETSDTTYGLSLQVSNGSSTE